MKKIILLGLLVLFLCPITIEYSHDGTCECDGLDSHCQKVMDNHITLLGYLSLDKDSDYIEDIHIGW
jgi:hypothetical protein